MNLYNVLWYYWKDEAILMVGTVVSPQPLTLLLPFCLSSSYFQYWSMQSGDCGKGRMCVGFDLCLFIVQEPISLFTTRCLESKHMIDFLFFRCFCMASGHLPHRSQCAQWHKAVASAWLCLNTEGAFDSGALFSVSGCKNSLKQNKLCWISDTKIVSYCK